MNTDSGGVTFFKENINQSKTPNKVRVTIVDDSAVVRTILTKWLSEEPDIILVGIYTDGQKLVDALPGLKTDIIILDIEMPRMDGLTALPHILKSDPKIDVIIASSLSRRGAEITMKALESGAKDYIAKPAVGHDSDVRRQFHNDLLNKIKILFDAKNARRYDGPTIATRPVFPTKRLGRDGQLSNSFSAINAQKDAHSAVVNEAPERRKSNFNKKTPPHRVSLKTSNIKTLNAGQQASSGQNSVNFTSRTRGIIGIGSSTGGPRALVDIFENLGPLIDCVPILIAQHMPPMFTQIMSEHLSRKCNRPVYEPEDGEALVAGKVYVAPGGKHMSVRPGGGTSGFEIEVNDNPPIAFCRPSVDYLFEGLATHFGPQVLGLILTGMGNDGTKGALAVRNAGGTVFAQDQETSVVWGMPNSVQMVGAASAILPLHNIKDHLFSHFNVSMNHGTEQTLSSG